MTPKTKQKNEITSPTLSPLTGYQIAIGPNVKVLEDKKSKTRVAHFPFEFPDGTNGLIIVLRAKDEPWVPNKDITSLVINFT